VSPPVVAPQADGRRWGRLLIFALAVVGGLLGAYLFVDHLRTDPMADVRAYYDAGARLNAGEPLYPPVADPDRAEFYRYPPLLAIVFRPIAALMPYEAAAVLWAGVCGVTFALTLRELGVRRFEVWAAVGILGIPIGWALAIGQAQVQVTWLLAIGAPWAVALAANLKVLPVLVAVFWLGRRDWAALRAFALVMLVLGLVQLVLEPAATIEFLQVTNLSQVGDVNNLSPYKLSPLLWAVLVAAGGLVAWRLAPTRWGWAAAVTWSTLATPRLLSYLLMSLLAGLRRIDPGRDAPSRRPG
jgi:hypothetical protein